MNLLDYFKFIRQLCSSSQGRECQLVVAHNDLPQTSIWIGLPTSSAQVCNAYQSQIDSNRSFRTRQWQPQKKHVVVLPSSGRSTGGGQYMGIIEYEDVSYRCPLRHIFLTPYSYFWRADTVFSFALLVTNRRKLADKDGY